MSSPLHQAGYFLVDTLFGLYTFVYLLRFLLQVVKADFYNPISQFIVKCTNPLLLPARRMIPGFFGLDCASLSLILGLNLIKLICLSFIAIGSLPHFFGLFLWSLGDCFGQAITFFVYALILQAIMSWIAQASQPNPVVILSMQLTAPLIRRAQRLVPPISGLDLSPMVVIIALQVINILLVSPLSSTGKFYALS
jgi:YggT family protein